MWRVTNIIQTSADSESSIGALIAFPKPEFLLGPPALGHIRNVALLRLIDGTVWMLVLRGQIWFDERLRHAADILRSVSKQAFTKSSIEHLLRTELEIESVSLESPTVDRVDIRQWDVEKVAFSLVRQPAASRSADESPESSEWTTRSALRDGLNDALRCFVDRMDPLALQAASQGRHFDLRIYNFLAHQEYRRYRTQFAQTFPGLLLTAVVAEPKTFGEELRSIVDSGARLIKGLAARWNVRPGVIRHLVGRASSDIGIQWVRDAKGLALVLNALHPQDLPGDSPAEWSEFNRIVATGQRLFLRPIWESSAGLEWLRECVRRVNREDKKALELWLPQWNELARIEQLQAALASCLRQETIYTSPRWAGDVDASIADTIDRFVLTIAHRGLNEVASQFADELERAQKNECTTKQILFGQALIPLVPEDFITANGATRVTSLTTDRQFRAHGTKMQNCLRFRSTRGMPRDGAIGTPFIVGLYDAQSGKALSTAEIKIVPDREPGSHRFITKQHTAKANRRPSRRCHDALREFLLHCQTDTVQEHLMSSWRTCGHLRGGNGTKPVDLPAILRCALGRQVYEDLLSKIRDTDHPGNAGARSTN